jgi:tetratricopeptide (TPR) repeat protein
MLMLATAAILLVRPAVAPAQQRQAAVQTERILILSPIPLDPGDSTVAVQLGDALRAKMEGKTRRRLTVISKDRIGEALEASGFGRDALLDLAASEQLARFLQADGYTVGWLGPNPARRVDIRLIELRRSGFGGWVHYQAPANATFDAIADAVMTQMEGHVRAAEFTRDCYERRDRRDFTGAKERARRSFEFVPNHPVAATCLAVVFEVERAPADSQINALELAVKGDSLNARAWEMLGRQYQALAGTRANPEAARADSLKGAEAFARQLETDPSDMRLRLGIAALFITLKQYGRARGMIDDGLKQNPQDLQGLQLKARACEDGSMWPCLVEALTAQYELDSTLAGNVEFYGKMIGAAQQAGDRAAALRWTGEAVRRVPSNLAFWRARAAAFTAATMTDSALVAYRRIAQLDPSDIAAPLRIVQIQVDTTRLKIDSTPQLDVEARSRVASRADSLVRRRVVPPAQRDSVLRALAKEEYARQVAERLRPIDSLLQRVVAMRTSAAGQPTDTAVWMNVAAMYLQPGAQLVQKRVDFPLGAQWLEKAMRYDVQHGPITTQANFFRGLAFFFQLQPLDARLRETKNCAVLRQIVDLVGQAKESLTRGASVQPSLASQLLQYVSQFEAAIPDYRKFFECR